MRVLLHCNAPATSSECRLASFEESKIFNELALLHAESEELKPARAPASIGNDAFLFLSPMTE